MNRLALLDPVVIGMFFALLLAGYLVRSKGRASSSDDEQPPSE